MLGLAFKRCLQDVEFLQIGRSSDLSRSLNLRYTKCGPENYAVCLSSTVCDSLTTIADTIQFSALECIIPSLTPSNTGEN